MKNIIVTILLLLTAPVFAAQPAIVAATPVVVLMPVVLNNPDFFEFTADQKRQIANIAQETNQKREALDQTIVDLRIELREEIMKSKANPVLIKQLTQDIHINEAKRLDLSVMCADGLRRIMTNDQWNVLISLTK